MEQIQDLHQPTTPADSAGAIIHGASGVWEWFPSTNAVHLDTRSAALLGMAEHTFDTTLSALLGCISADNRGNVQQRLAEALRTRSPFHAEFQVEKTDQCWLFGSGQPLFDQDNNLVRFVGMLFDITYVRSVHGAESNTPTAWYRNLFNQIDQGFCICQMLFDSNNQPHDYRFLEVNPLFEDMTGLHQALGRTARELVPNLEQHWFDVYGRVSETGESVRFVQGSEAMGRWFDVFALRIGPPNQRIFAVVFKDITKQRRAEEAVRESNQHLRAIYDGTYGFIGLLTPDGTVLEVNRAWLKFDGTTRNDMIGRPFWQTAWLQHTPGAPEQLHRAVQRAARGKIINYETPIITASGEKLTFEISLYPVRNDEGDVVLIVPEGRDVSERKRIEETARASEERFRTLAATIPQLIWTATPAGNLDYLSEQWAKYIGVPIEEMHRPEWKWRRVIHPQDQPRVMRNWAYSVASGEPFEFKLRFRHRTGEWRWQLARGLPTKDAQQVTKWVGTCTDIHESEMREQDARFLSELGEQIRVAENAETLAASVVHTIGEYFQIKRCYFAEIFEADNRWRVRNDFHATLPSIAGDYRLSDFDPAVLQEMRSGRVLVSEDTKNDPRSASTYETVYKRFGLRAHIIIPFLREGQWISNLVVVSSRPQVWHARQIALLETIAERTWNAIEQLQTAQALRNSQISLALALQAGQAGTFEWDIRRDYNYWSPELEALYGLPPHSFENNYASWANRVEPEDTRIFETGLRAALDAQQREYSFEFRAIMPDGTQRWLAGRAQFEYDADGLPLVMRGLNVDIQERKQSELNTRFLLDLDARLDLLADSDEIEQKVVEQLGMYLNVERCHFGYTEGDSIVVHREWRRNGPSVIGKHKLSSYFSQYGIAQLRVNNPLVVYDITTDPRTAATSESHAALETGAFMSVPIFAHGDWIGTLNIVSSYKRAWRTDKLQLMRDVVVRVWPLIEQAKTRAALRESEARLQVLYAQEQAARTQAEEASRLKDDFLATVSHELRTPLTSLLGYAQLLQMRPRDEAYTARTLEKMVRSARTQAQLIEDLLDVSRIISGKLRLDIQAIDLVAVAQAALDTVRPTMEAKGLLLELDLDPQASAVLGDTGRLQQVIWNLLSNATKFTPSSGTIRLQLQRLGSDAQLSVSDTGQGISASFLPYVFDRFRQAESASTRAHNGLGLGLAIVRHLVELHGGTVRVASPGENQGSTFTVRLPLIGSTSLAAPASQNENQEITDCPPQLRGLRILVTDDQTDILELIHDILTPCGAVVRLSSAPQETLTLVQEWWPDLLISDIAMPEKDGYWLIDNIRALPSEHGGATPAIALTAYVRAEERTRVLAAGFQEYVPKPVEPNVLRAIVASMFLERE